MAKRARYVVPIKDATAGAWRLAVGLCFLLMLLSPTQLLGDSLPVAIDVDAPRAILHQLPFSVSLSHPDLEGGPVAYRLT